MYLTILIPIQLEIFKIPYSLENNVGGYMIFSPKEIRIIHEVLKYLCSDNANFMAIFSHYIPGRVVI